MKKAPVRIAIDGEMFSSLEEVHAIAKSRGSTLHYESLCYRIRHGADTWAAILAPPKRAANSEQKRALAQRKRDEMAAVIAALDARKAAMR